MKKHDISTENWREYHYADGGVYRIEAPLTLHIVESGGHRVIDQKGITHCPRNPWVAISWFSPTRPVIF